MHTIEDLDAIASISSQTFEITPFKRDYDAAFAKIANILYRYGITENPRNLRFRFTLCMQEFFDSIPENQWKIKDTAFIKQSKEFAITKFKEDNRTDHMTQKIVIPFSFRTNFACARKVALGKRSSKRFLNYFRNCLNKPMFSYWLEEL
jgi:hypothetical protein